MFSDCVVISASSLAGKYTKLLTLLFLPLYRSLPLIGAVSLFGNYLAPFSQPRRFDQWPSLKGSTIERKRLELKSRLCQK